MPPGLLVKEALVRRVSKPFPTIGKQPSHSTTRNFFPEGVEVWASVSRQNGIENDDVVVGGHQTPISRRAAGRFRKLTPSSPKRSLSQLKENSDDA
jgi:hypothetical protein